MTLLKGVVVDVAKLNPLEGGGLSLKTEDGELYRLIAGPPYLQDPAEHTWYQSRSVYEHFINKKITVSGHISRKDIFDAIVKPVEGVES